MLASTRARTPLSARDDSIRAAIRSIASPSKHTIIAPALVLLCYRGKTIGGLARPMLRGIKKLDFKFIWTMAAYDLVKLPRLIGAAA